MKKYTLRNCFASSFQLWSLWTLAISYALACIQFSILMNLSNCHLFCTELIWIVWLTLMILFDFVLSMIIWWYFEVELTFIWSHLKSFFAFDFAFCTSRCSFISPIRAIYNLCVIWKLQILGITRIWNFIVLWLRGFESWWINQNLNVYT